MSKFGSSFFDALFVFDLLSSVINWCGHREILRLFYSKETNQIIRACVSLIIFIQCQLDAIRLLVVNNLDVQARGACRPLREAAGLLVLVQRNPALADDFVSAQEPHETNEFWARHVRKGRIKKEYIKSIFNNVPDASSTVEEMLKFIDSEEAYFSQSIHPSYNAGMMHLFNHPREHEEEWKFLEQSASVRTMRYCSFILIYAIAKFIVESKEEIQEFLLSANNLKWIGEREVTVRKKMMDIIVASAYTLDYLGKLERAEEA